MRSDNADPGAKLPGLNKIGEPRIGRPLGTCDLRSKCERESHREEEQRCPFHGYLYYWAEGRRETVTLISPGSTVKFIIFLMSMNEIDLRRADLNLLVVFQVLLAERHVGRAAKRLVLTQSAASHALGRLRNLFA